MKFRSDEGPASAFRSVARKALLGALLISRGLATAQQLYDNQDGVTTVKYSTRPDGRVEQVTANPQVDSINPSPRCAKFKRNRQRYDYVKITPTHKLVGVAGYATHDEQAPRLHMKLYTDAPVGSLVELQLGRQAGNAYPEGTHSQYQARTTVSGAWQELEFRFVQTPKGSETSAKEVDQITLMLMPNTSATFTFYFDDLSGPAVSDGSSAKLWKKR